jgi:hypothetical protein
MATLSTTEMKLIDSIFGMYSGWVLDFSNSTFDAFFRRDVGVNIYDAVYATYGDSKGKRLRGFLENAQSAAVVKALSELWIYREAGRLDRGEKETVPNARARLSEVVVKLGGKPLAGDTAEPAEAAAHAAPFGPSEGVLAALEAEFLALTRMDETPQNRGYAFEKFLKHWSDTWGLDAHASFRTKGEQIDGSFQHDGATYLVEAKWYNRQVDAAMLHGFQGKLLERPDWTRGLYVSYGGFTGDSFDAFTARRLIMMDGTDIYYALNRRLDLADVIRTKARYHAERRQPFAKVTDLFPA